MPAVLDMAGQRSKRLLSRHTVNDELCSSTEDQRTQCKKGRYYLTEEEGQTGESTERPPQYLRPGVPRATSVHTFVVPDKPSPPLRPDDKDGHYVYELGDNLGSRYKILSKLGEGTFGRVLECWDRKYREYVAIKIVRNVDKYRHAAMIELEVLNTLEVNDPQCTRHCVNLREWFNYRDHVCMVFEKLGLSLYDFLRKNEYQPFPLHMVQYFAQQLLEAVAYMHNLGLVHTDLKPENILLCSQEVLEISFSGLRQTRRLPGSSEIKVIDFGSATFEDQYHSSIVSTRHYRAPEVILGLGWSYPCDLWSVGCILVELVTGDALFQTHENLEHLAMMEQVLGPIPEHLVARVNKQSSKYFINGRLNWPEGAANRKSIRAVKKLGKLRSVLVDEDDPKSFTYMECLEDLISKMLIYDGAQRLTARQALNHPFFQCLIPDPLEGLTKDAPIFIE